MSWDNNGGPWGGGGNQNPWGKKPGSAQVEDLFKNAKKKFQGGMGGGSGNGLPPKTLFMAGAGLLGLLWVGSGFYFINEGEQAAILKFGKWDESQKPQPGLRYHLPYPIEHVVKARVEALNRIDSSVSSNGEDDKSKPASKTAEEESSMLTGDENIVVVNFTVLWTIKNLGHFLFNTKNPQEAVKEGADSAVREVIGQTNLDRILTEGRGDISQRVQKLLQKIMDDYGTGIEIRDVQFKGEVPSDVIDAFRDVQRARADQERAVNEATSYANSVVPVARGDAEKILQEAQAYQQEVIARAEGEVGRFNQVYDQYKVAPEVMRTRMYLETMEALYAKTPKIIVNMKGGQGILPYLPLQGLGVKTPDSGKGS